MQRTTPRSGSSNAFSGFRAGDAQRAILDANFERPNDVNPKIWPSIRGIKAVGLALVYYAAMSVGGVFFGTLDTLVRQVGYNRRSTQRALRILEFLGFVMRFEGGPVGRQQARDFIEERGGTFPNDRPDRRSPTYVFLVGRSQPSRAAAALARGSSQPTKRRRPLRPRGSVVLSDKSNTLHQAYCSARKSKHGIAKALAPPDAVKLDTFVALLEQIAKECGRPFNVVCLDAMAEYMREDGYDGKLPELGHPLGWFDKYAEPISLRLRSRYQLERKRVEERERRAKEGPVERASASHARAAAQDIVARLQGKKEQPHPARKNFRSANAPLLMAHLHLVERDPPGESPHPGGEQAQTCSPFGKRGPP